MMVITAKQAKILSDACTSTQMSQIEDKIKIEASKGGYCVYLHSTFIEGVRDVLEIRNFKIDYRHSSDSYKISW